MTRPIRLAADLHLAGALLVLLAAAAAALLSSAAQGPLLLLTGAVVYVLTYVGVARLRSWAEGRQLLDVPNERSSHSRPTVRGGGLLISSLSLLGLMAWGLLGMAGGRHLLFYGVAAALIAAVSFVDDLRSLPNRIRFGTHCLCALVVVLGVGHWSVVDLPLLGRVELAWAGLLVTLIWLVGLTNAYNFMDGIDGLAGSQALIAGTAWLILGWLNDHPALTLLGLLLAGSSLGFLRHNWPPAKVFMGDVGSAFLGFTFAFLAVLAAIASPRLALAGVLCVWPFIFDAGFTFIRRARLRENVFAAHRSHLYQRLVIAGRTHRHVTLLYAALAIVGALLGLAWAARLPASDFAVAVLLPLLCASLWLYVVQREQRHGASVGTRQSQ